MPTEVTDIVCAHSPDSDDAYMFYALATKKIRSNLIQFRHVLEDIQTLNQKAEIGQYELTAISYHAYPYVADKYMLMAAGSSVGDDYGPMVVATKPMAPEDLKGKRIAVPGRSRSLRSYFGSGAQPGGGCRPHYSRSSTHLRPQRIP
jgi:1,4-dihydroxy-6-naphthoate synthase